VRGIFFLIMIIFMPCDGKEHSIINNFHISSLVSHYDKRFYRDAAYVFEDISSDEMENARLSSETKEKLRLLRKRLENVFDECIKKLRLKKSFFDVRGDLKYLFDYLSFNCFERQARVYRGFIKINELLFKDYLNKARFEHDPNLLLSVLEPIEKNFTISCEVFMKEISRFVSSSYSPSALEERLRASDNASFGLVGSIPQIYIALEKKDRSVVLQSLPTCSQDVYKDVWYKRKSISIVRRIKQLFNTLLA